MKHFPLLFALLLGATALAAQTSFPILKDLEGTWYQGGRQSPTFSEWYFTDPQTFVNQVFIVRCGDTTLLSRAILHQETASLTLSFQTEGEQTQNFRLVAASTDEMVFQNENTDAQPQQLAWEFFDATHLTVRTDATESTFFRRNKLVLKTTIALQLGANSSTLVDVEKSLDKREFQRGWGTDLSLSLGLRGNGPLGFNFELGLSQRQIAVSAAWRVTNGDYTRNGSYRNIDFYAAFLPEVKLGKARQLAISAGVASTFARKNGFRGTITTSDAHPDPRQINPRFDLGHEASVMTGLAWQLPKAVFPAWHPSVYCRGTWGLGYAQMRAVSVGVGLRLK